MPDIRTGASILVDGAWRCADDGGSIEVLNPATGAKVGVVAAGRKKDVDMAVASARRAFDGEVWIGLSPAERARRMFRVADLIERRAAEIAELDILDNGMTRQFAQACVTTAAEAFRYFGGWVTKIAGIAADISAGPDYHCYTRAEPVGVAALIVPWNGPFMSASQKVATALAAGCTAVLKPAENTSLSSKLLGEIVLEAGVPPGVLNIVTGLGSEAGQALVDHPDVDKVSFTGSTAVGRLIVRSAAENFKRVTMELGGKSPVIVFDDCDLERTIPAVASGIFRNAGQVCLAGSRLYVQRSIYEEVAAGVARVAREMRIGDGSVAGTQIGPLISEKQRERVLDYIAQGRSDGARVLAGGEFVQGPGFFVQPTVLADVDPASSLMRDEIFGPVLCANAFDDLDEVVRQANDTDYGLAAAVYTRGLERAHKTAKRLRCGTVYINAHSTSDFAIPFGGFKHSGWGRERGQQGIEAFLETKSVVAAL